MRARIPLVILGPDGRPVGGATVAITRRANGAAATVYTGETGAGIAANPVTSDAYGRVLGWLERDAYAALITGVAGAEARVEEFEAAPAGAGAIDIPWLTPAAQPTFAPAATGVGPGVSVHGGAGVGDGAPSRVNATTVRVLAGTGWIPTGTGGLAFVTWAQTDVTIPVATTRRIDRVVVRASGAVERVAGAENAAATLDAGSSMASLPADAIDLVWCIAYAAGMVDATYIRDARLWAAGMHYRLGRTGTFAHSRGNGLVWDTTRYSRGQGAVAAASSRVPVAGVYALTWRVEYKAMNGGAITGSAYWLESRLWSGFPGSQVVVAMGERTLWSAAPGLVASVGSYVGELAANHEPYLDFNAAAADGFNLQEASAPAAFLTCSLLART